MQDASIDRIIEDVESGRDARLGSTAGWDQMASRLALGWTVVRVVAPAGGLSLSALIGQLSGRKCFDDQDDSALEIGFRRLTGADRTVLLLDAMRGLQRPALRYLQHVGRNAPGLVFVIAAGPQLDTMLAEPALARLRARLTQAPAAPVETVARAATLRLVPATPTAENAAPTAIPADWSLLAPAPSDAKTRKRRRSLIWMTSSLGLVASAAFGAWIGGGRLSGSALPIVPAVVALPAVTAAAAPTSASVPQPAASDPGPVRLAESADPALASTPASAASLPSIPAFAASVWPELADAAAPPIMLGAVAPELAAIAVAEAALPVKPPLLQVPETHRFAARPVPTRYRAWARVKLPADSAPLAAEATPIPFYGTEGLPPEDSAGQARQRPSVTIAKGMPRRNLGPASDEAQPPAEAPFIGTFSNEPYGARIFRYGR